MLGLRILLLCLSLSVFGARGAAPPSSLTLSVSSSETLHVTGLARGAVADSKIARVKAIPPSTLLITGIRPGSTMVRYWRSDGTEAACEVTVLSPELMGQYGERATPAVVKISLQFLEMDRAMGRESGIRWPDSIHFSGAGALQGDLATSGLNYSMSFTSAQGWIAHLVREGWARLIANPDLYVRLGEEAKFHSGGEIPVPSTSENYGRFQRHVEWKPFGLTVKVRPQSGDKYHISSDIRVEISELSPSLSLDGIPALTRRRLETKMNSSDGETVILSGLLRQTSAREEEGVPILAAIPLLGPLFFSRHGRKSERNELLMAITFALATRARDRETLDRFRERFGAEEEE